MTMFKYSFMQAAFAIHAELQKNVIMAQLTHANHLLSHFNSQSVIGKKQHNFYTSYKNFIYWPNIYSNLLFYFNWIWKLKQNQFKKFPVFTVGIVYYMHTIRYICSLGSTKWIITFVNNCKWTNCIIAKHLTFENKVFKVSLINFYITRKQRSRSNIWCSKSGSQVQVCHNSLNTAMSMQSAVCWIHVSENPGLYL